MKHRTLASANLRRFIGAAALTAMLIPSVSVFADAADVSAANKKAVGDRLLISDFNQLIDILTPLNVDGTGILTAEGNVVVGTGGDFTVTDGATILGGTTTTTGLLTANGGVTVEDGDTVTINGVGLTAIETYAEGLAGTWATVSNPATDLSTGYDTQLATMGWSAGLLKYQMTNLDITYFNGFKALGTPATGDIMVWDATADGGNGSWVGGNAVPDDFTIGDANTDTLTVNSAASFTDTVGVTGAMTISGLTAMKDLQITSDTTPVNLVLVDNTEAAPSMELQNGTDFGIYSDGGTTDVFLVDAATGNTAIAGTLGAGNTTVSGTLDVTGIADIDSGINMVNTNYAATGITTTAANDYTIAVNTDQDLILSTPGTGTVQISSVTLDSEGITEITSTGDTWATDSLKDNAIPTTAAVHAVIQGELTGGGSDSTLASLIVTGLTQLNGGLTMDSTAFTVADTSGNVHTNGTLDVDGATTLDGAVTLGDAIDDVITFAGRGVGVIQSDASGVITSSSTLAAAITAPGITMTGDIDMGSNNISSGATITGTTLTDGTASINAGDITGVGDIDATTGTIATFDATTATATNLVIGVSTSVTATAEGTADNDKLTTQGYVDDLVGDLAEGITLDTSDRVAFAATCTDANEGEIVYHDSTGVGTFWGCALTGYGVDTNFGGGDDVYTWVALSIFES